MPCRPSVPSCCRDCGVQGWPGEQRSGITLCPRSSRSPTGGGCIGQGERNNVAIGYTTQGGASIHDRRSSHTHPAEVQWLFQSNCSVGVSREDPCSGRGRGRMPSRVEIPEDGASGFGRLGVCGYEKTSIRPHSPQPRSPRTFSIEVGAPVCEVSHASVTEPAVLTAGPRFFQQTRLHRIL